MSWAHHGFIELAKAVAQICNLHLFETREPFAKFERRPTASRRYSRLKICATPRGFGEKPQLAVKHSVG
jgi:hypothetical protein